MPAFVVAVLLAASVSVDALAVGFAYGAEGTKIKALYAVIVGVICAAALWVAIFAGDIAKDFMSEWTQKIISFFILICLGIIKLVKRNKKSSDIKKNMSVSELAFLSFALSIDGLAVGFGAALTGINATVLLVSTLALTFAALLIGGWVGGKAMYKNVDLSWLSGTVLIVLAFTRLI